MDKIAVLVDAGYFWVQAGKILYGEKIGRDLIRVDYSKMRQGLNNIISTEFPYCRLLRIYWYDGPDEAGGKCRDHGIIEKTDDFKLRMGSRNSAGHQKAVDGLIIADLIGLAQNRAISDAVIISGDADLVPGVIAAQNLGIRVSRIEIGSNYASSPSLIAEVDRNLIWNSINQITNEMDKRLLSIARKVNGNSYLTDEQKKLLRADLKKISVQNET